MKTIPIYTARLIAFYQQHPERVARGELTHVTVEHGFGCPYTRTGECTCYPAIEVLYPDEVLSIGTGGAILERKKRS